jgi:hypothetical protein
MFLRIFDWKCAGQSSFLVRLGIVHTEFATCVCGLMLIKTGGGGPFGGYLATDVNETRIFLLFIFSCNNLRSIAFLFNKKNEKAKGYNTDTRTSNFSVDIF